MKARGKWDKECFSGGKGTRNDARLHPAKWYYTQAIGKRSLVRVCNTGLPLALIRLLAATVEDHSIGMPRHGAGRMGF